MPQLVQRTSIADCSHNQLTEVATHPILNLYYRICQKLLLSGAYIITLVFTKLRVLGKEHLKKLPPGPVLVIANHKSFLDPLLIGISFPFFSRIYPLRFITKDSFFSNFFTRFVFSSLGTYPAYSGQGLEKSLTTPRSILSQGGTVVFFPEGKRIKGEGLGEAKIGAAVLASEFPDSTIVPIAIAGLHKMGKWGMLYPRLTLTVSIGEPFPSKEVCLHQSMDSIKIALMDKIKKLYDPLITR